uniref:NB-ARC domain-containing protein n=1 Tax=Oryza rufipogon TaxID=4529 RepID=A0A0E0R8N6_ORYRU
MAGLFASSAVKWAIDNLSSLLPAAAAAGSSQGLDALEELRMLERTMRRIHATLRDAEQRWNIREERIVPDINAIRQTSSFVFAPRILGREKDMENVIAKLLSGEGSRVGGCMSVLAIVGMGGLGKTTLAQLLYNDPTVQQSFDLYGWVYVSECFDCFDVNNITRKIISSLTQNNCDHIQSGELQGALANQIKDKRIFLVLDDIWNERSDYWELLITPMFASRCCDIIVTTRNERVASLSPDESWSLFKQTTFIEQENISPANLVEIARMVSEKCKGLPLVIKTVGSILRFETDEIKWRDVLQSELWDLEQTQNE